MESKSSCRRLVSAVIALQRLTLVCAFACSLAGCTFGSESSPGGMALPAGGPLAFAHGAGIMPEIVSSHGVAMVELTAVNDPSDNLPTFEYQGDYDVTPTIRVNPGDTIVVDLYDGLARNKGMMDDVNLHFHGLGTSPMKPSDDVLTMLALPGQSLHYVVKVPKTQPPGLYWYHTHVHGFTNYQVGEGGMSGAIVVEGIASYFPELAAMPENILLIRELGMGAGDVPHNDGARDVVPDGAMGSAPLVKPVRNHPCRPTPGGIITINREYQPVIQINPGQREFFRVLNATGHRNLDLQIHGVPMQIVAVDGYPIQTYPGEPPSFTRRDWVIPPAGRVEFVATGGAPTNLSTLCFFSGPIGDPDPAQVLALLRPGKHSPAAAASANRALMPRTPLARMAPTAPLPAPAAHRLVVFSENNAGFFINGKMYSPSAPPMFVVHTGTVEQWTVENVTSEVHDFHLHQVHFLVQTIDGHPNPNPIWTDTFVVPYQRKTKAGYYRAGSITLIADFRNPMIRGTFLFHCHILDHEDQGMMAKIQAL
jgi:suppressor of ftsI